MIDAVIFDFDGVVVDSEPMHLASFRQVLGRRGIELSEEDYYGEYVGFDDHDCFAAVLAASGRPQDQREIARMTAEKTKLIQKAFGEFIRPLPGAVELMRSARRADVPLAICSGALREEIALAATTVGAMDLVEVLVAAQDVARGKPDPGGYVLALRLLGERRGRALRPGLSWVIEDTAAGVQAAKAAGCNVLAVTNTYDRATLAAADRIVDSLEEVTLEDLE